jgi:DNA repair exonuclease SbcCD ATPase subunit
MAEGVKETVLSIRVDSAQAIQQLADYSALIEQCRKREQELKQSIKEGNDTTGEQAKELLAVVEARKQYTRQTQIASKEVQNNITTSKAQEGSLKQLRAELSNLTKQYDELSRVEREGAFGKDLQKQINDITKELKGAEEGTQRFYRNVGNYTGSLGGLFEKLQSDAKAAIPGIEALGFKSQSSFGWISVVAGALVGLIGFFKKAVTSSEELSMRSSEMFAFLKTGAVQLQNLLQSIGNSLLNWAQSVFDLVEKGQRLWAKLTGREAEYNQQLSERKKLANELTKQTKEQNAITLEQRKINEKNADSELKIAKLRAQAADKVTFSARQRVQFIKEAADEERRISERNYELAKREYELQERIAKNAGNSAEANEAKSQAYTKMIQQETAYFNKVRELNAQVAEATNQAVAQEMKLAQERKKANEELLKDFGNFIVITEDELNAEIEQLNKDLLLSYKNRVAEAKLMGENTLALEVEAKKAELDALHKLEEESDEEFKARQLAAQQAYVDAKKALADYEVQIEVGKWNAIGSAMNALSGLLGEFSEESKAAAVASKALALGEIAIKTGVALAGGIAQAQSVPFPANLAAIATTVATIIANIATAVKTVKSAKFSTGGYVSGEGTGTSDSIPAMLSNGESVNNARSTSMFAPIYSSLNQMGGGVPIVATQTASQVQGEDMLARAFAKGMSEADIRVGVDEITRVQNRVKVVENLGVL